MKLPWIQSIFSWNYVNSKPWPVHLCLSLYLLQPDRLENVLNTVGAPDIQSSQNSKLSSVSWCTSSLFSRDLYVSFAQVLPQWKNQSWLAYHDNKVGKNYKMLLVFQHMSINPPSDNKHVEWEAVKTGKSSGVIYSASCHMKKKRCNDKNLCYAHTLRPSDARFTN